ncbi:hypothetical protein JZO76_11600 [Enterococcus sp. MJM12]|uniref:YgiT-type zinc finger protein n=1 Tax=Candidatus Enterococcus myersii TaxID=2815322 RepID=A0ABS3H9N3_9ENTE|nr:MULTISPECIES: hypothetical protein [Enterococcus]MBO0450166.1 hypothetical protein [Enterococcus sp. MJM12]MCD1023848.1 hypothetical protein [Enterococcus sp. SMC-9]MDT2739693.1 hypothetical protein [Enterococcus canintestini]WHA10172.1 hypothetical protein P3T75_04930 [Enterococcus montenegrensis]
MEVEVGKTYLCKPVGLTSEVAGFVEHTYTNTVLISVTECERCDRPKVIEAQNRLLVRYEDIRDIAVVA